MKQHAVHLITVVSSKLTSCINGNSTFSESLKLHFCFFESIHYCRGDQTLVVYNTTAASVADTIQATTGHYTHYIKTGDILSISGGITCEDSTHGTE
jgi:hypothetical protein